MPDSLEAVAEGLVRFCAKVRFDRLQVIPGGVGFTEFHFAIARTRPL